MVVRFNQCVANNLFLSSFFFARASHPNEVVTARLDLDCTGVPDGCGVDVW
jgi:hypothetical protein